MKPAFVATYRPSSSVWLWAHVVLSVFHCCCVHLGFSSGKGSFLNMSANSHLRFVRCRDWLRPMRRGAGHFRRAQGCLKSGLFWAMRINVWGGRGALSSLLYREPSPTTHSRGCWSLVDGIQGQPEEGRCCPATEAGRQVVMGVDCSFQESDLSLHPLGSLNISIGELLLLSVKRAG